MSFRTENKYRINISKIHQLYEWLKSNNGEKIYPDRIVSSIYFDNLQLSSYNDSIEGVVPRKKIRIRFYNENFEQNSLILIEKKINSAEGRFKVSEKLLDSAKFIKNGYFDHTYGLCFPKTLVKYNYEFKHRRNKSFNQNYNT